MEVYSLFTLTYLFQGAGLDIATGARKRTDPLSTCISQLVPEEEEA